jgi:hypothetical protein
MEDDDRQAHDGVSVDMDELMKNIKTKAMTQVMPMQLNGAIVTFVDQSFYLTLLFAYRHAFESHRTTSHRLGTGPNHAKSPDSSCLCTTPLF